MKIVTIIGARPQIIKASAISRAINNYFKNDITEIIVHTGQHYDPNMSEIFFEELSIPKPNYNLSVGSGNHGAQTAKMITGIEEILQKEKPNYIVLHGDTNSTLAGAIAASKLLIPIVHIEAGLRSFNKAMPEEVNRIMCDHVSTLLFSPTITGYKNLQKEGFKKDIEGKANANNPFIYHSGDVMYDNSLHFSAVSKSKSNILEQLGISENKYILSTIHRNANTDDANKLSSLFNALHQISIENKLHIVLPLHPRTNKMLATHLHLDVYEKIKKNTYFKIIEPVSFLDMIALESNAKLIMTDSGGVQKEAFFFKKPCIILRPETEWIELVTCGMASICDTNEQKIINDFNIFNNKVITELPNFYGDGHAAKFILQQMLNNKN